jgi:hypothetical protein
MVSRSLEKMVLIALGLTTVVIIGVPALMFAINTLENVTDLERADAFAARLLNETRLVDTGEANNTAFTTTIPNFVTVSANGNALTIDFDKEGVQAVQWSDTFLHPVSLLGEVASGQYSITIRLVGGVIEILFV